MNKAADLLELMTPITWLLGDWQGMGKGRFPTMDDFEFQDTMHFKLIEEAYENEPLIHFEEVARTDENGKMLFKHWETGYFKPQRDGTIQFYVCHNTGRVEITYGKFRELDLINKSFEIEFTSSSIRNDKGTATALKSKRELVFNQNVLHYTLDMSTTDVPHIANHLKSKLKRITS